MTNALSITCDELYATNLEHLLDELGRIDCLVRSYIAQWRATEEAPVLHPFPGLCITNEEADALLKVPLLSQCEASNKSARDTAQVAFEIDRKRAASAAAGVELRLHRIRELFDLSSFDIDVLLISLAAELDVKFQRLYAYAQDDATRKLPSIDLAIKLLCNTLGQRLVARERFSLSAPLQESMLITVVESLPHDGLPFLSRSIKVDDRIIAYILGSDEIDPKIQSFSEWIAPSAPVSDLVLAQGTRDTLENIATCRDRVPVVCLYGPYGTGKNTAAAGICHEERAPMLVVDSVTMASGDLDESVRRVQREARLHGAAVFFDGFEALFTAGELDKSVRRMLNEFPGRIFLGGERNWRPAGIERGSISVHMRPPSYQERRMLWLALLKDASVDVSAEQINALASKFRFSGGQIRDAILVSSVSSTALGSAESTFERLYDACRVCSSASLAEFARRVDPRYSWRDIVLPDDIMEQLREIAGYIKYKGIVYSSWGFDRKLSQGDGLNVLFSGPSGTGKTMAAQVIAREARLDLFKVNLSSVVSKYVGETAKNLDRIFTDAEASNGNAILFFDEADALFGKRSEIRDSHDRYANTEINYLLQRMEEHEGTIILASNFKRNIDEAFQRRLQFAVEFPFPDEKLRKTIWQHVFPSSAPVDESVDFDFLATLKLSGGSIKNVALAAAFLAASDDDIVRMEHIIRATKREYQKMGKLCTAGDFGPYHSLVV
ncbi:MAG: AAA family ATPase [Halobacteriota archaeon]